MKPNLHLLFGRQFSTPKICLFWLAMCLSPSIINAASRKIPPITQQQQLNVTGQVTDEMGAVVPGVSVKVKNKTSVTTTNEKGNYTVILEQETSVLVFSAIGFATQEIPVNGRSTINVRLIAISNSLSEVAVIGYGTQRRERVTSAVATVKASNFVKGAVTDAGQLVRGKVAGLSVTTPDGNPTGTSQINLRGITSILSGREPLVLIDGVPGTLTTVAPEDIESVDVLKDGSAAAIYGTRGTNGVILITTKKVSGELAPTVEINSYLTTQRITRKLDFMSPDQYRQLVAQGKPGATDYGASTDWLKEITHHPFSQVYNATLKGGTQNTNYIANINYRKQEGLVLKSDNRILYPRLEVNHHMFDGKLKFNVNLNGYQQEYFSGGDGTSFRNDIYRNAITYNPTDPIRDPQGNWTEHTDKTDYANPVSLLEETDGLIQNNNFRTLGTITYNPISDLKLMLLGSRDLFNITRGFYETKQHLSNRRDRKNGYASRGTTRSIEDLTELTATYTKGIEKHDFTGLAGYSWRQTNYQDYWMQNWDFPADDFSYNNMGAGLALKRGEAQENSYQSQNKLVGYFFRLNYSYDNKYLLMASIRREGSSKFGANYKYGSFPAVSAGWNIKNEPFLQDNKVFSALKIRGGYGVTGTEPLDPYMSLDRLNFNTQVLINGQWVQAISPSTNANPNLRWERKQETNIGVDFGFLDNRITGVIDLYQRTTKDLLLDYTVPTPPYLYNTIRANAASMENKGVEVQLNGNAIDHKNFKWNTTVNYSTNRNKLVSLSDENFQLASGFFDTGDTGEPIQQSIARVQIGQPIGNFWGFKSLDIDDAGHWIIEGKDGNPKPIAQQQADDKQIIGNGLPKHFLSWNNSFVYKDFDLNIVMRGAFGFQILNTSRMFYEAPVMLTRGNLLNTAYDNVYGKRSLAEDQSLNYVSYYIEDGDYWKIDNITLGYNFRPKNFAIKSVRLYASGSNLATFTKYKGIDPEVSIAGLTPGLDNKNRYPATSTYSIGAMFNF